MRDFFVGRNAGCALGRESQWSTRARTRQRSGKAEHAAEVRRLESARQRAAARVRVVLKLYATRFSLRRPVFGTPPVHRSSPPHFRPLDVTTDLSASPRSLGFITMADTFPCGCLASNDANCPNSGAVSTLPAVHALAAGGDGALLSVDGICFFSCPCGNLVFLHDLRCAYYGAVGVPAAPLGRGVPAPVASSPAQTVATSQAPDALPVAEGRPLSLTRDGLCVVSSSVRLRNDSGMNDEVVTIAERIHIVPM